MPDSDFGSAFSGASSYSGASAAGSGAPIRITSDEVDRIAITISDVESAAALKVGSPIEIAAVQYGVALQKPGMGEEVFVGLARNPNMRSEEEEPRWHASADRRRQQQVFTFEVEISDHEGNPTDHVPVEVRGNRIKGNLPSDGTPVAVYGKRHWQDGNVYTHKVINLRSRSSIRVYVDACFVATAAYGSLDASQVVALRTFRDQHLVQTVWGRVGVHVYYWCSPPLARWVAVCYPRRRIARAILDRLVERIEKL